MAPGENMNDHGQPPNATEVRSAQRCDAMTLDVNDPTWSAEHRRREKEYMSKRYRLAMDILIATITAERDAQLSDRQHQALRIDAAFWQAEEFLRQASLPLKAITGAKNDDSTWHVPGR